MLALSAFYATTEDGRWHPGIGDPTLIGWLTVLAYFVAGYLCYRAVRQARTTRPPNPRLVLAWMALTALMLLLGLNKQLDLQSYFTELGRDAAKAQGWYAERHDVQRAFIYSIVAAGTLAATIGIWWLRREFRQLSLAILGAVFIMVFVFVRASSMHRVDGLLHTVHYGVRMNWVLELGGIACVSLAAHRFAGSNRERRKRVGRRTP